MKALIERSLRADPAFTTIFQERVWRSARDPRARRRPDVQATAREARFAFEVQLSTTFLDVVVGRRLFYRNEGALLVWVLGHFDPGYRRLTTDDLLFSNNSNILVVNEETARHSESTGAFHLRCFYRRPVRAGDQTADVWEDRLVRFAELARDTDKQRVFYFDYDAAAQALQTEIDRDKWERQRAADENLRNAFFTFWHDGGADFDHRSESIIRWSLLRRQLTARGVPLPEFPDGDTKFRALMNAVLSARAGYPIGWRFQQLIEVAHHLSEKYPQHLLAFGHALEHFGHKAAMEAQDTSRKWERRRKVIRAKLRDHDPDHMPDPALLSAMRFFFPEIADRVEAFITENDNAQ